MLFVNEDYELFHLVLFYLYTNRIHFITSEELAENSEIPSTGDAEGIYAIAHRLMVESLEKKALHFLQSTCTIQNITSRTFGTFAAGHKDPTKLYDAFFLEHWDEVKHLPEFEKFFVGLEDDPSEYVRVNTKFRHMMGARA